MKVTSPGVGAGDYVAVRLAEDLKTLRAFKGAVDAEALVYTPTLVEVSRQPDLGAAWDWLVGLSTVISQRDIPEDLKITYAVVTSRRTNVLDRLTDAGGGYYDQRHVRRIFDRGVIPLARFLVDAQRFKRLSVQHFISVNPALDEPRAEIAIISHYAEFIKPTEFAAGFDMEFEGGRWTPAVEVGSPSWYEEGGISTRIHRFTIDIPDTSAGARVFEIVFAEERFLPEVEFMLSRTVADRRLLTFGLYRRVAHIKFENLENI